MGFFSDLGSNVANAIGNAVSSKLDGLTAENASWSGINPKLLGTVYKINRSTSVDAEGKASTVYEIDGMSMAVSAPIKQGSGTLDINPAWVSPFENETVENKRPIITGLLQSGALSYAFAQGATNLGQDAKKSNVKSTLDEMIGRSSVTKLSSTQIFSAMPPTKFTVTMLFRAFSDPYREVVAPVSQLVWWAMPQMIASGEDYYQNLAKAASSAKGLGSGNNDKMAESVSNILTAAFPSIAPCLVGYRYGNRELAPLVVESISLPADYPMDVNGNPIHMEVTLQLGSLQAQDARDVGKIMGV